MNGSPSPTESALRQPFYRTLALLLLVDAALVLSVLPRLTLWNIDEGRISAVSREMASSGDWLTPRIGGIPFGCYPPLPYWLMAISGSLFGWNEFAMRLPAALCGIFLVGLAALITRRLAGDKAGLFAGMVLATTPSFFVQEKMCRADVMTLFFATAAFERFLAWAEAPEGERRRRDLLLMWISVSLGVLTKGPLSIAILGVAGLVWFILRKQWRLLARMGWLWGLPLAAAIIVPWYVLVYRAAGPAFIKSNLFEENFRAFTDGFEQDRPWHFYITHAPPLMLPWVLALGLVWKARGARGLGLALAWFGGTFLFLSLSSAKRPSYVVYMQPAFAASAGITLAAILETAPGLLRGGLLAVDGLVLVAAAVLLLVPSSVWTSEKAQLLVDLLPLLAGLLAAAALATAALTWRRGPEAGTIALASLVAAVLLLSAFVLEWRWEYDGRDGKAFCLRVRDRVPPGSGLGLVTPADGSYHFYYGAAIPLRTPAAGPCLLSTLDQEKLQASGRRYRELDRVLDARKRVTLLAEVLP